MQSPLQARFGCPPRRRPFDEGFTQQPATLLAAWQRMLPLLHRL